MKLTQATIENYFSLPTKERTILLIGKNPYDFVSRNSDTLLITIGDSWTWGADLTTIKHAGLHIDKLVDDHYRLANVYGGILSARLNADFLNLGESGSGNHYIFKKLQELSLIVDKLEYSQIIVLCTLTEAAREFNSQCDINIDYPSWLMQNTDYNKFLQFINSNISNQIINLKLNIELYFSTNFVDPIGFDCLQEKFLSHTWIETWCEHNHLTYSPTCYLISPWIFDKLQEGIFYKCPSLSRTGYLTWAVDALEVANDRAKLCKQDNINFGQLLHPLAVGHRVWADYLYDTLF